MRAENSFEGASHNILSDTREQTRTANPRSRTGDGRLIDLADYLEWEQQDYMETVVAVTKANKSVQAGRVRPAEESL